jgi:hypothetical protein
MLPSLLIIYVAQNTTWTKEAFGFNLALSLSLRQREQKLKGEKNAKEIF